MLHVAESSPLRARLHVSSATVAPVENHLVAPAAVEADPARTAKVSPPLPGRVVKLFVGLGDPVKEGQPLLTLDSPDLVSAESDCLKAASARAQAERTLQRQQDLLEHGIGARREVEQAQTDLDLAGDELHRAEQRLRLLGIDPGKIGQPLTVRAPISGRIVDFNVAQGEFRNDPTVALMTIADLSSVWVTARVQEQDVRRLKQGGDATASLVAYPDRQFPGKVHVIGDLLEPDTRTVKVRLVFDNPERKLKPGMFATVDFQTDPTQEVLVPTSAVLLVEHKNRVFVEVAPWTFESRDVTLGQQLGDRVVVRQGLAAGARIVTQDAVLLQ